MGRSARLKVSEARVEKALCDAATLGLDLDAVFPETETAPVVQCAYVIRYLCTPRAVLEHARIMMNDAHVHMRALVSGELRLVEVRWRSSEPDTPAVATIGLNRRLDVAMLFNQPLVAGPRGLRVDPQLIRTALQALRNGPGGDSGYSARE